MDAKPVDEFELENRTDANAEDCISGTLPDVPETETSFDDSSMREIDLKVENTSEEVDD